MRYKPNTDRYNTVLHIRNWKLGFVLIAVITGCGLVMQNNVQPLFPLIALVVIIGILLAWRVIREFKRSIQGIQDSWLNISNGKLYFGMTNWHESMSLEHLKSVRLDKVAHRDVILTFADGEQIIIPDYENPEDIISELSQYIVLSK